MYLCYSCIYAKKAKVHPILDKPNTEYDKLHAVTHIYDQKLDIKPVNKNCECYTRRSGVHYNMLSTKVDTTI